MPELVCQACGTYHDRIRDLQEIREALEAAAVGREATIRSLKVQLSEKLATHKLRPIAVEVLRDWNEVVKGGKARKPDSDARVKCVIARLGEGFTEDDLKLANRGAKHKPWVKDGEKFDDATTVFKSASSVQRHIDAAPPPIVLESSLEIRGRLMDLAMWYAPPTMDSEGVETVRFQCPLCSFKALLVTEDSEGRYNLECTHGCARKNVWDCLRDPDFVWEDEDDRRLAWLRETLAARVPAPSSHELRRRANGMLAVAEFLDARSRRLELVA